MPAGGLWVLGDTVEGGTAKSGWKEALRLVAAGVKRVVVGRWHLTGQNRCSNQQPGDKAVGST